MKKKRKRIPQVIISSLSSIKASRDKLQGILGFERLYGPWQIHLYEERPGEQGLKDFRNWGADGIILEGGDQLWVEAMTPQIIESRLPVVIIDPPDKYTVCEHSFSQFCRVVADGDAIGRMGAEYFLDRRGKNFAFVDDTRWSNWSRFRKKAFAERVAAAGHFCHVYPELNEKECNDWGTEQKKMIQWLRSIPKPVGIMAAMDTRGRQILDACMIAGINIPLEVQVLGVDNDEMMCENASTPMSSIAVNSIKGGFLAARLLHGLMEQKIRRTQILSYQPIQIVERCSTKTVFFEDRFVAVAREYIRSNAGIGINVADIARHLKVSPRFLQLRFKNALGYTVIEEIMRVRFNRICTLLSESDMTISEITRLCGFENESYLGRIFKKRFGKTMKSFRRETSLS